MAAGAVALPQACALVIGMDLGTTVTALMASLGANLSARRTAAAHVLFNLLTAVAAFLLLPTYLQLLQRAWPALADRDPAFALTAFHTGFNLVGVLLVLPFTAAFAALIRWLVRPLEPRSVDALPDSPPADSHSAIAQAHRALVGCLLDLQQLLLLGLHRKTDNLTALLPRLEVVEADLDRIGGYLDQIHLPPDHSQPGQALVHLLHGLDHLQRLQARCEDQETRFQTAATDQALQDGTHALVELLEGMGPLIREGQWEHASHMARSGALRLGRHMAGLRQEVLRAMASGELDGDVAMARLDAMRWLSRVCRHQARACHHLGLGVIQAGVASAGAQGSSDPRGDRQCG